MPRKSATTTKKTTTKAARKSSSEAKTTTTAASKVNFGNLMEKTFAAEIKASNITVPKDHKPQIIPTGSLVLDLVSDIGGFPTSRMIELNGEEGCGKTTIALGVAVQAQAMGIPVLFLDFEQALDLDYARHLGVDMDNPNLWRHIRPDYIEQAASIAFSYLALRKPILIIIDSLPTMVPKKYLEDPDNWGQPGFKTKLQSDFLMVLQIKIRQSDACVIVLNQMRADFGSTSFGKRSKAAGGHAFRHAMSMQFNLKNIGNIQCNFDDALEGRVKRDTLSKVKVWNKKNKLGRAFMGGLMYLEIGEGISNTWTIMDESVSRGLIKQSGSWYKCADIPELKGQGLDALFQVLKDNPHFVTQLCNLLGWLDGAGNWLLTGSKSNRTEEETVEPMSEEAEEGVLEEL